MAKDSVVLMGVGDIGPVHEPVENYGTLVKSTLATADIRFAQCERNYSEKGGVNPKDFPAEPTHNGKPLSHIRGNLPLKAHMINVFTDCGFDIVSMAGNHNMDWGGGAIKETVELFNKKGIQAVGAGANLKESRRPAIIEKNGVKVALLAYCSVVIDGYEAGPNKPGLAPLRAHASFEPAEYQAGMPPHIITTPYQEDLDGMLEDIANVKSSVDSVVISLHWGIHHIPKWIAEYQPIVTNAAFKAGADLILGHHAHVPKAIEYQNGKTCFYSLGNFIFSTDTAKKPTYSERKNRLAQYGVFSDAEDFPLCPHGKDSKRSLIAKAVLSRNGIKKSSFLPLQIDKQLRPEVLKHDNPQFKSNVEYMDWASEDFNHKFTVEGDEVVITGA